MKNKRLTILLILLIILTAFLCCTGCTSKASSTEHEADKLEPVTVKSKQPKYDEEN